MTPQYHINVSDKTSENLECKVKTDQWDMSIYVLFGVSRFPHLPT